VGHLGNLKWDNLDLYVRREANIYARCFHCNRTTVFDAKRLYRYFLAHCWHTNIESVYRHLYCIRCKRRPGKIGPSRELHNAPRFLPETDDQWKRLVRRLRG